MQHCLEDSAQAWIPGSLQFLSWICRWLALTKSLHFPLPPFLPFGHGNKDAYLPLYEKYYVQSSSFKIPPVLQEISCSAGLGLLNNNESLLKWDIPSCKTDGILKLKGCIVPAEHFEHTEGCLRVKYCYRHSTRPLYHAALVIIIVYIMTCLPWRIIGTLWLQGNRSISV